MTLLRSKRVEMSRGPRPNRETKKKSVHGVVFCLIQGNQERGRVGNGIVFSPCGYLLWSGAKF